MIARIACIACIATVLLAGCNHLDYRGMRTGEFRGRLDVRWVEPDRFLYVPDADDPLVFVTAERVIAPAKMYTDGGSIPRLFWNVPGYSPWGYAPAYIVHDWLFQAHHCRLAEYQGVSFEDSARILAEGVKTLMETHVAPKDETTLWAIYEAVRSPIARRIWDDPDACTPAPDITFAPEALTSGVLLMRIDTRAAR